MKRLVRLLLAAWGLAGSLRAADTPAVPAKPAAAAEPAVMLPPMLVEESSSSAPWFYARAGDTEVLSRCSASVTRELVEAWMEQLQIVRGLVPDEFLMKRDVPSVLVLYAQDLEQTVSAEIKRDIAAREAKGPKGEVNIAPGMRLSDRDMHATISYVDESRFNGTGLSISSGHVRYLLQARVPELPGWLLAGLERMVRGADFRDRPITLQPMIWRDSAESDALAWDAARPRAILPANELFASDTWSAMENQHPRRAEIRAGTQELFVRWAIVTGGATRDALWKFAARAAEGPVTEELFESCFGLDYAELRDRLSDYLPKAVSEMKRLSPADLPRLPPVEVGRATPNQIARLRGEWERLAITHVQRRLPEVREPYVVQARRTLHRVYDAGDRDPRLLATLGLVEVDSGNEAGALAYLEPAVAANVVRPRAYYELARLRLAQIVHGTADGKKFSVVELTPVLAPLQRGLAQAPPLPEGFALLAEAWARCDSAPEAAELAELERGARLFPRRAEVALPTARALARHGHKAEAAAVLDACAGYVADKSSRSEVARLRAEVNQ